jgi:hypothetical protein
LGSIALRSELPAPRPALTLPPAAQQPGDQVGRDQAGQLDELATGEQLAAAQRRQHPPQLGHIGRIQLTKARTRQPMRV